MAWMSILHKGHDRIIINKDGEKICDIIIAGSSIATSVNLAISAPDDVEFVKEDQ